MNKTIRINAAASKKPVAASHTFKRNLSKLIFLVFAAFGLSVSLFAQSEITAQKGNDKPLVVYFSWSGNAKALAGQIAQATGGELFEIKPKVAYPSTYDECTKIAKREMNENARPTISGNVANMAQYSTVFLCYPIWWGTMPMVLFTFLESNDFSGKTIYPLATHGSSRFGRSLDDLKKTCPKANIGEGLAISAFNRNPNDPPKVTVPNSDLTSWLQKIGMSK